MRAVVHSHSELYVVHSVLIFVMFMRKPIITYPCYATRCDDTHSAVSILAHLLPLTVRTDLTAAITVVTSGLPGA